MKSVRQIVKFSLFFQISWENFQIYVRKESGTWDTDGLLLYVNVSRILVLLGMNVYVSPKFICWISNSQCDSVWRWGLWKVIRLKWGHKSKPPCDEICCCSVTQSCPTLCKPTAKHTRLPCPSPYPRACSNSCLSSQWCHPIISSLSSPSPPTFNLSQHQGLF